MPEHRQNTGRLYNAEKLKKALAMLLSILFPAVGPTGVSLGNLPFTLMPAVGLAMPLLIPHKRRRREED